MSEIPSSVAKKSDQVQDTYKGLHFWTLLEICVCQEAQVVSDLIQRQNARGVDDKSVILQHSHFWN